MAIYLNYELEYKQGRFYGFNTKILTSLVIKYLKQFAIFIKLMINLLS